MFSTKPNLIVIVVVLIGLFGFSGCSAPTPTTLPQPPAAPTLQPPTVVPPTAVATSVPTKAPAVAPTASPTVVPPTQAPAAKEVSFTLTWYGHSTFVLSTSSGLKVLIDPTAPGTGYKIPTIEGVDLVTTSHEHSDHNAVNLASGSPQVLKGLAGNDWAKIDQTIKGVRVRTVGTYHDARQGAERGKNAIFIFELNGLRMAHCGDLGHILTPEQVKELGAVDILLIPVGGTYTVDAKAAVETINLINPKIIIPMHYKTADLAASLAVLAPLDEFLKLTSDKAALSEAPQSATFTLGKLPEKRTVVVMKYK